MSTGQKLWRRARVMCWKVLLSKRPEMFLPDLWPSYFSKARDALFGVSMATNRYIMGIEPIFLLGHP